MVEGRRTLVLHNHFTLWIEYHQVKAPTAEDKSVRARIISVYVTASSYDSSEKSTWRENCEKVRSHIKVPGSTLV